MTFVFRIFAVFAALSLLSGSVFANDNLGDLIDALAAGKLKDRAGQIEAIAETGDPRAVPALSAMRDGALYFRKSDKKVFLTEKAGSDFVLFDPLTGDEVETLAKGAVTKVKVNNRLRRQLTAVIGSMTLESQNPEIRLAAARTIFKSRDVGSLEALEAAIQSEQDEAVRSAMELARAAVLLNTDAETFEKVRAVELVGSKGGRDAIPLLKELQSSQDESIAQAAEKQIAQIEKAQAVWDTAQTIWFGISLGSVLLLAAIGLAVTFGVMGVINMAHGEMVMLGAYTTFVVQESSSRGEFHPSALTEPDLRLSPHPAPTLQPPVEYRVATGQKGWGPVARYVPANAWTPAPGV
ncbi:ABC transporter permease subunit [Hoeflea sp.]|uniref:HEAT repeat domain-containing protein n=1 Tax=Hoeflea sp. TaxID=1940281 RepID=UPI003B028278